MLRRRTSSRAQRKGRRPDPGRRTVEYEGNDYPLDTLPPEDLPVRDIAEHEEQRSEEGRAWMEAAEKQGPCSAGSASTVRAGVVEVVSSASEIEPRLESGLTEHELTPEPPVPEPQAAPKTCEPPAQPLLPGLECDDSTGPSPSLARKRSTRPFRSQRPPGRPVRASAQIELWPDDAYSVAEG